MIVPKHHTLLTALDQLASTNAALAKRLRQTSLNIALGDAKDLSSFASDLTIACQQNQHLRELLDCSPTIAAARIARALAAQDQN